MKTQNNVLSYRIDLYFYYCRLKNEHSGRNIDYEIKRQKSNQTRTWL